MSFILKMAWRDSRASRRRLFLFSLSIVLGIAALVGIGSFAESLKSAVDLQTKTLVGADLSITSRKEFTAEARDRILSVSGEHAEEVSFSSLVRFVGSGQQRMVQVRALAGPFPFYGELVTEPSDARTRFFDQTIMLEETLMTQFGVHLGDDVQLGKASFKVIAAIKKIPGESAAVALLAPRVFIPLGSLPGTDLLKTGSFSRHRFYLKLPASSDAGAISRELKQRFATERLNFETVEDRKRELGNLLADVYSFLALVAFIALFLGGVGIASAIHAHVSQKLNTVAVLRCLGVSSRTSFAIYLTQGSFIGVIGAMAGAGFGVIVQLLLPVVLKDFLPFQVDFSVSWGAVLKGAASGLSICICFVLLPLLPIRRVSPLLALRSSFGEGEHRTDFAAWLLQLMLAAAVFGFATLQSGRWRVGLWFTFGMIVCFGVLVGVARTISWATRKFFPKSLPYIWRQGLANLYRPNNRTVLLLVSLGLGTFLMLTLVLTRATLLNKISSLDGAGRPNLMFYDIQDDQIEPFQKTLAAAGAPVMQSAPVVTMRISSLKGKKVEELLREGRPQEAAASSGENRARETRRGRNDGRLPGWTLRREYRSTYRGSLGPTDKLVSGQFVGKVDPGVTRIPVSIEEGLAKDMQLQLGDEIIFDVQGVPMTTFVSSIRQVEWQRLQPNFFISFPEGVLEPAPKFFIAATRVESPAHSAQVQQAVSKAYPNVSVIDLAQILQTIDAIVSKIQFVITFMAMFTVVTGAIVLVGSILTGKYQRIRESVLLRTLGASKRQIAVIHFVEYAMLGTLATLTGAVLALVGNALLARFLFHAEWSFPFAQLALAWFLVAAATLITGLLSDRGVYDAPPLAILREET